jgi:hypothetical protein
MFNIICVTTDRPLAAVSTNTKEPSPWEADSRSVSQEIPRLLRNPKFRYYVHKSSTQVPILSQMNPVQTFPNNFFYLKPF